MRALSSVAALLLSATFPALAQAQMAGDVTLSFAQTDIPALDVTVNSTFLGFSVSGDLGSNVSAGLDLGLVQGSLEGFDIDADLRNFGADIAYRFDGGLSVGAYLQRTTASANVAGFDLFGDASATSTGLTLGYGVDTVKVSGFAGRTSIDPELPGEKITDMGLAVRFLPTDSSVLGGSYLRSKAESDLGDASLSSLGAAGGIRLGESWSIFAGIRRTDFGDLEGDLTDFGLGLGYMVPYFPGQLFAEVSRATVSDGVDEAGLDTIQLGISFPFGTGGSRIPTGTVAGSILSDNYSPAADTVRQSF